MQHTCEHGERTRREGVSAKGPWIGHFCILPKGDPSQCAPEWESTKESQGGINEKLDAILEYLSEIRANMGLK